jgi:hypothetical protein
MTHVVWVHGIGDHKAGYSDPWRMAFDRYLKLPPDSYVEVLWETVMDAPAGTRARAMPTQRELADEEAVREELRAIIVARESAMRAAAAPATPAAPDTRGRDGDVVAWPAPRGTRGFGDWLLHADEYLGDFVKYLVNRSIRTSVKERFKERLQPLIADNPGISVVAHSWGTVVAYDALIDLVAESPNLDVVSLVTLGSPLWMVRRLLEDRSGAKPQNVGTWVNVHARLDVVGSWLNPAYKVDREFEVPNLGHPPHGSYFWEDNVAVQRDLVARYVLGRP